MVRIRSHVRASVRLVAASLLLAVAASTVSFSLPSATLAPAHAATWTVDTTSRTEADVRTQWELLKPVYAGSAYAIVPSVVAPYAPGDAAVGYRADGINIINFARYLAGLPSDVTLDPTRNSNGQYGAVLLRASTFSHTPAKPADMPQAFYDIGYASTSSSNIGAGYATSWSFQKGCLDDSSSNNLPAVGHRRWLLNPRMLYTGIGYADGFHTTYAFDSSRPSAEVSYDYIAWPSAGVFPIEFANRYTPWSITLNPARYDWDATKGFTVTMTRVSDGRTWTMDASDTSTSGEYFATNFNYYGVPNAFIFRPNPADFPSGFLAGEQYDVTLSGGIYAEGTTTAKPVSFRTTFMTLTAPAPPVTPPTPPTPPTTPTTPAPVYMSVFRFYNRANGSHFYTASITERDAVIARYGATYSYEGPAYSINVANPANCAPLYRFYNNASGSHFYTPSAAERDAVLAKWSATFTYEGPAYNVSLTSSGCTPMYRFYNKANGSHFYTVSAAERDTVIANLSHVYSYEGVAYHLGQ